MNLEERLRGVVRPGVAAFSRSLPAGSAGRSTSHTSHPRTASRSELLRGTNVLKATQIAAEPTRPACAAEVLGGAWRESRGHRYVTVDRRYPVSYRLGCVSVGDCLPAEDGTWPGLPLLMAVAADSAAAKDRILFVDLETTGLAGGAGTYAFLVGFGWFEDASFRVRQFLLTSYSVEQALLEEVAALAARAGGLVTYNGKAFDLPLIDTRFLFHRMSSPFNGLAHLDMLHRARRLWRPVTPDGPAEGEGPFHTTCRLSAVEETVLGHVRQGDVPGFEIPSRYFHYVRSGDARPLGDVLEHNRLDLLALAMLTATAATLLHAGPDASRTAREALGLGQLYERSGLLGKARASFLRAAHLHGSPSTRAEALLAYGVLCRRAGQFDAAADAWRRILTLRGCPTRIAKDATDALAVHHEHRLRDFHTARRFAAQSLQLAMNATRREAAQRRVARLDRKLGEPFADRTLLLL